MLRDTLQAESLNWDSYKFLLAVLTHRQLLSSLVYHHVYVCILIYHFEYVHILILRYFKGIYMKIFKRNPIF